MNKKNETVQKLLTDLLRFYGFKDQTIPLLISQFAHETANFTSKSFKEGYNPFGMKLAKKRITTASGELYNHAKYESLADAIHDFRLYYDLFKYPGIYLEPLAIDQYVSDLKKNSYFEDSKENYLKGVKHFYKLYYE